MKPLFLIITGICGIVLSTALMISFAVFISPTLHEENIREYESTDLAKQFQLTYPESGMVTTSGTVYEQQTSFTYFKNARHVTLTFYEGIEGKRIAYKCERIISSQEPVEIFNFENPTQETIKNNVCGEYD